MTKRERYLAALRNETVDKLVWAPNFDYWLRVNQAEGTMPERYDGMSRDDIVRAVGGCIWARTNCLNRVLDASVKETIRTEGTATIHEYQTPIGTIRQVHKEAEKKTRTGSLEEHFIKDLESLRIMKYVVEATHYEADYTPVNQMLADVGDDGVVLTGFFCVPFIQFAKTDAGYVNAFYMWMDHKEEVDALINAYFKNFLEGYKLEAEGPWM